MKVTVVLYINENGADTQVFESETDAVEFLKRVFEEENPGARIVKEVPSLDEMRRIFNEFRSVGKKSGGIVISQTVDLVPACKRAD